MDTSSGYMDFCLAGRQHHWYFTHLQFFSILPGKRRQPAISAGCNMIFSHAVRIKKKKNYVLNYTDYLFQQFHFSLTSFPWIHTVLQNVSLIPGEGLWDLWMIHFQAVISCWFLVTHLHANSAPLQTGLKWAYICSILGCTKFSIKPEEDKSSCYHWINWIF